MSKTIRQLIEETETKCTFEDFPIGTRVKVITPCEDFTFFYGETGEVVKNSGRYLGIEVEFDKPRIYQGGRVLKGFGFNPKSLEPIIEGNLEPVAKEKVESKKAMAKRREPTARHKEIAEIAANLGAKVTAEDVRIVFEATRVEYENRLDRPAAGGRAKHDPEVWGGLKLQ